MLLHFHSVFMLANTPGKMSLTNAAAFSLLVNLAPGSANTTSVLAFHDVMPFIDAVTTLLLLPALCLLPFWCGGLCAAHGIGAKLAILASKNYRVRPLEAP